ncbi:truncated ABC transporter permease/ATP binding protein [Methanocella paludicola SANAE]|uniref:Truncated ABC transporter permease/ATP binding protein n=2 Tax=Methanocella TaxID=570266 RepID=D1YWW8_METPS|nr:truncated ABC transporter permease/ATP binding protein [Methanocella paludicola SANAE]
MQANIISGWIKDIHSIFMKPEAPKASFKLDDLSFFFQFVKPIWKMGVLSLLLTTLISGVRTVIPLSSKVLVDFVILNTGFSSITNILTLLGLGEYAQTAVNLFSSVNFLMVVLFFIGVIYALLQILQGYMTTKYQQELTYNLQTRLFDHVLRFPLSFFKNKQTGYLLSRVSDDVDTLQYLFSSAVIKILSSALFLLFSLFILLSLNATLVIFILCTLPLYVLLRYFFFGRIRALSYKERETHAKLSQDIQEVLSGVEVEKTHATEDREVERVSSSLRNVIQVRLVNTVITAISKPSWTASSSC